MNTLEDRIRAATRAAAGTVPPDGVPPLRLPARAAQGRLRPGSPWARRLAPFAAAAAVVAVVVAALAVSRTAQRGPAEPENPPAGPPISRYVASGQVPAYYVAITHQGDSINNPWYAVVRSTATGAATATIQPSAPNGTIVAVTAAADDRTFVLDEDSPASGQYPAHTFYMLRLSPSGRPQQLTRLPVSVPRGQAKTGFALSPDGSKLAVAVQPTNGMEIPPGSATELSVYTLASGAKRTWSAAGSVFEGAKSMSWTADQRGLAFVWVSLNVNKSGVWLLNLGGRGSDLLADSRQVTFLVAKYSVAGGDLSCSRDWIVTPDGSAVVCGASQGFNEKASAVGGDQESAEVAFLEYSTATGKITRTLGHWTFGDVPSALTTNVLWSNPSGSVLIGVIPAAAADSGYRIGVISGNRFTPLPAAPAEVSPDLDTW